MECGYNRSKVPRLNVMFEEQEEGKKLEKNKYEDEELDLEILRLN